MADLGPGLGVDTFADFLEWSGAEPVPRSPARRAAAAPRLPPGDARARDKWTGESVATITTVTKIELGPLAPALFEVPAGYRIVESPLL